MGSAGCCGRMKSCCSCLITLIIMGVVAVLCWHFLGRPTPEEAKQFIGGIDFGDFTDVLKNITDIDWTDLYDEDPFVGDNTTNAWKTEGTGLTLELRNALDDNWQEEFQIAMDDWQESEVLTLTTTRVAVDNSCGRVDGLMLVCNGNFGETGWVGINEVEIEYAHNGAPGFIVSSVAKMNEYYLYNANFEKRRYTMCHEIGHGFGLPHTDENPNNSDLGNCLDYTNTPENNLIPGEANMARLRQIYLKPEDDDNPDVEAVEERTNSDVKEDTFEGEDRNRRNLRQRERRSREIVEEIYNGEGDDRYLHRVVIRYYLHDF